MHMKGSIYGVFRKYEHEELNDGETKRRRKQEKEEARGGGGGVMVKGGWREKGRSFRKCRANLSHKHMFEDKITIQRET